MDKEKSIEMIDEYLLEPNNINKEWVECLQMCRQALEKLTPISDMTDNEIIKALECCSFDDVKKCDDCPYYEKETKTYCVNDLIKDTLDLINRQNAEIETLKTNNNSLCITLQNRARVERAEAIKEFAEKFKGKAGSIFTSYQGYEIYETKQYQISAIIFDNLVKEMVGDKE